MKRLSCLLLGILLVFSLCACQQAAPSSGEAPDQQAITEEATEYFNQMMDGDFETFFNALPQGVQDNISAETIQETWEEEVDKLGGLPKNTSPDVSCYVPEHSDQIRVEFVIPCDKGNFKVFINYFPDGSLYNYVICLLYISSAASDVYKRQGRIYGLLGRNGAGKTTIMKMILGLTPITSGEVDVFGQNIKGHEKRIYPRIGAIIETPGFYPNLTGTENLEIFAKLRGTPQPNAVKNALEVVGLPYKDKKLFSKYSLGMKQRLGIANAILHDPELLILDEPTNGLDPIGIAEVRNFIKNLSVERGKTILISSHILSEISLLADDIGIIDHGVLLEESSMDELEKKNRKYIQLQVSDIPKASLILERQFHVTDYAVQDEHNLRLYDTALDMAAINKALVVQDVAVISSQICNDTLEDYFKQITGGEGIA